jgi:uncharacterized heparinase superfamily protein
MLSRRGLRRALRIAAEPLRPLASVRAKAPQRLSIAPQDIRTVDPTIATEIYSGYFAFGGKIVNAGATSPFQIEAPSKSWARALGGRPNAEDLMWEPRVVSRRILAFLSQSPMILEGAEADFYRRFMSHFARARVVLMRALSEEAQGEWRLFAAIALAQLAVCSDADQRTQRAATQLLALLPLRQAYAARGTQMPAALLNAIDRMMPMLRLLRHGDGTLALFNGMSITQPELIATLLTYDDVRGRALLNAPYSGYQRMEARGSALIVDSGRPPPPAFSKEAHAGCLAFEFSPGGERIIVN